MPDYSGGFAGDRAGIMNLEGVLGNVAQQAMSNRLFQAQLGQQAFERQMAAQQFGLQQKQFALSKALEPWSIVANMLGWGTQGADRLPLAQALYKQMMGGKSSDISKILSPITPGEGLPSPGQPQSNPSDQDESTKGPSITEEHPLASMALSGLLGLGGGMFGPWAGLGVGAGTYGLLNNIRPYGVSSPDLSVLNYKPTATPSPMGSAMGLNSLQPQNITKRQSRAAKAPSPQNSVPTAQALPNPSQ